MLGNGRFARWVEVRGSRNAETQSTQREAGRHEAMKPGIRSPFLVSRSTPSLLNLSALRASAFPQFFPSV